MKPRIQFATAPDGVRVAFYTLGSGTPIIFDDLYSHIGVEWETPTVREMVERTAAVAQVVRFDHRGTGLSDHGVPYTLEGWLTDIETVADKLGLGKFVLISLRGANTPVGMHFAARYPDRVSHLIVFGPRLHADRVLVEQVRRLLAMPGLDWRSVVETYMRFAQGWDNDASKEAAWRTQQSVSIEEFRDVFEVVASWEIASALPRIRAPVLLLATTAATNLDDVRAIAAGLTDAELVIGGGIDDWLAAGARFIAGRDNPGVDRGLRRSPPPPRETPQLRTVLFTDLVDHTEMMRRLGDTKGRDVLREHERITRETLKQYGGTEIKTDGDSFMVSFGSVTQAMDCAIALQRAFAAHTQSMPEPLHVRVGLNAGEPIEEDGDLFGSTVILASRIAAQAGAGEILIPAPLRHLLSGKNYAYTDRGETVLKGFEDAVRLYEVRWRE